VIPIPSYIIKPPSVQLFSRFFSVKFTLLLALLVNTTCSHDGILLALLVKTTCSHDLKVVLNTISLTINTNLATMQFERVNYFKKTFISGVNNNPSWEHVVLKWWVDTDRTCSCKFNYKCIIWSRPWHHTPCLL
jgi:hypothetical protein